MRKPYNLIVFIFIIITTLSGCTNTNSEIDFDVTFKELNQEKHTATFVVTSYPNEDEFNQINSVIIDSMNEQKLTDEYTVYVYSDNEKIDNDPFFGTVKYKNNKLENNKLTLPSKEEYQNNEK